MSQEKKSNVLDNGKLAMTAPKLANGAYPPKLKIQTFNNNPQFTVFSGVASAKRSGIINAGMDTTTFFLALRLIEKLIDEPTPDQTLVYEIENHGGRGSEKTMRSKTILGKDNEGVMFISILDVDDTMPKVRFNFDADYYHKININGMGKAEISCIAAQAFVDTYRAIMGPHLTESYEKVVFQGGQGGGKGGGGGSYGNSASAGGASGNSDPW